MKDKSIFVSAISGLQFPAKDRILCHDIRIPILTSIKEDYPDLDENGSISDTELNLYREKYISKLQNINVT